ncbi:unnamed protein product [Haemonchus placei]|uniref:Fibronectin type III domain protein n=1 Tax=Haemonchus placei TaxID=6290 RepID=A0A158QMZ9_HAEPC|nr:unnamed protein product [Haemonchus placei]
MKSRTRSDNLTCVAVNPAGQIARSVSVQIRGPGSPPSSVTLQSERGGYTVSWLPPSHPNGNITKYVVYHTLNKDDPLSDWQKLVLDGTENSIRVLAKTDDAFYVRVQAAADSGPGVISDIVAIEKDITSPSLCHDAMITSASLVIIIVATAWSYSSPRTHSINAIDAAPEDSAAPPHPIPIGVSLEYTDPPEREHLLVESWEQVRVRCIARGKPQPQLFYVLTEEGADPEVEEDVWQLLDVTEEQDSIVGEVEFSTITSKTLHCKAKNTAGSNSSSLTFLVKKPGDAPRDIRVLSIDSRDIIIVWKAPHYPNLKIEFYELFLSDDVDEDEEYWQKYRTMTRNDSVAITRSSIPTDQLKPSHDYFVKVRAVNRAGAGPENPPTGVNVDINEANIAVVRWDRPNSTTEILSYVIYFTRDLGLSNEDYREWQTIEVPATQTRYKFDYQVGLKPKTFYRVRVSAKNDVAEGPVSETKEFETAYSEDNSLIITFTAVRDPDDHTNVVQVTMSADGEGLKHSTMYWVKITALLNNPTRFVQASKPRWFRTGDGRLRTRAEIEEGSVMEKEPNLFENLRIVCRAEGSPAPTIAWFWNGQPIRQDREGWTMKEEQADKKTVSILTRSSVRESGHAVCMAISEVSNATAEIEVRVQGPGSAPRNVVAVGWRNQLNISWEEPSIPNGIIMKYIVYYATRDAADLSEWDKVETEATEIVLETTSPETRYLIRVQAATPDGPGIISDAVECYSDRRYQPIEMNLVSVDVPELEAEPNQTVTFRCSAQGQPIPSLFYSWDNSSEFHIKDVLVTERVYHVSGLFETKAFTNRTVVCRAMNKHENVTTNRTLIIRKPGDVPTNVTWMFDDNDSLFINWDRVRYPNGNTTYILYLSNFVERVAGPPVRIPQVPYNVNVTLQVSAENEWGEGAKSAPITFPTPNGGPKNAPSITSIQVKDVRLTMAWVPPTMPNGEIKAGKNRLSNEDEPWEYVEVNGNRSRFSIDQSFGLLPDSHYQLKISATNERHEGPASEVLWFDTISGNEDDLPAPENVTAYLKNSSLIVYVPTGHPYQNYIIYIRPEFSDQYWKYEATNVTESQKTIVIEHFPLDKNVSYQMKISGVRFGHESRSSREFRLMVDSDSETTVSPDSELLEITTKATVEDKRRIVKEPPL